MLKLICCISTFKVIGLLIPEKKTFNGFYHIWAWWPSWSCNLDNLNKLLFPHCKEAPHEIWLQSDQLFQRRCLKMLTTYISTYEWPTEAYLYYKLRWLRGAKKSTRHKWFNANFLYLRPNQINVLFPEMSQYFLG